MNDKSSKLSDKIFEKKTKNQLNLPKNPKVLDF